jgi:cytochrome c2
MWRSALAATALMIGPGPVAAQTVPIPQTSGYELILRCVMCHSVEIAVQQRFGPQGWSDTLDRMIKYGAPIPPEDKRQLVAYLLRHFRDPDGR